MQSRAKQDNKHHGGPCRHCGGTLRYNKSYSCVPCSAKRSKATKATFEYKQQAKRYWMRKRYGMTPEQMVTLLDRQGGCCAICKTTKPGHKHGWFVDHDHVTGEVRGVLCNGCNVALGGVKDSIKTLRAAVAYLTGWDRRQRVAEVLNGETRRARKLKQKRQVALPIDSGEVHHIAAAD